MEDYTIMKVYENQIMSSAKHNNLTELELATLIDEYLAMAKAKNISLEEIEQKLGMTKRLIYKHRSILKIKKETYDQYKDKLSAEQISIVSYSVKDKEKIPEVLQEVVEKKIPSNELVYKVSEINDDRKVNKHIINEIQRQTLWAMGLKERLKKLSADERKAAKEAIENLVKKLEAV